MFSFKRAAAAGAVAAILPIGFAAAASASVRPAGTPSCGATCLNVSSVLEGPAQVLNATAKGKVTLRHASNAFSFEDVILVDNSIQTVRAYEKAGLIPKTSYAYLTYPYHYAAEVEFAPDGVATGLCVGVAKSAFSGEGVTRQPCGVTAKTLWIFDPQNGAPLTFCLNGGPAPADISNPCPLINGSDANFSIPEVLTATGATSQVQVQPEHLYSSGNVFDSQLWQYWYGVTP